MGCPTEVEIGRNLTFSICTHDPDTGVLTDAGSNPTYRVYQATTTTPILTGTMSKLDDGNTTGFYVAAIACLSGNGFNHGFTYTVYIEATVDTDKGGISYAFTAYDQRKANLTQISDSGDAADRLEASALTITPGTVNVANTTPTTTLFAADDITEATADHFIGRTIVFYDSGDALFRQQVEITDYEWDATNSEAKFTTTALTEAPSDNDKFVIV